MVEKIDNAPDGGWGWVIVFSGFFCNVLVDGVALSYGVLLPMFSEYFDSTKSKLSVIGSLLLGTYLCSAPIVSLLIIKFGCRLVTIAGSLVAASGFLFAAFSPNLDVLILTYGFIGGFGFGMMYIPPTVCASQYFKRKRPTATGIVLCGSGVGSLVFSYLLNELADIYDWKNVLVLMSGIVLNGTVCGMCMRPLPSIKHDTLKRMNPSEKCEPLCENFPKDVKCVTDKQMTKTIEGSNIVKYHDGSKIRNQLNEKFLLLFNFIKNIRKKISTSSNMLTLSLPIICAANIFGIMAYVIPVMYIVDRALTLHVLKSKAAFLLSVTGITNTIFRVLGGLLVSSDRVNSIVLMDVAMITGAVVVSLHPFCDTYLMLVISAALFGICIGIYVSVTPTILCELFGLEMFSYTYGIVTFVRGIAAVSGPPVAGLLFQQTGSYDGVFYFGGAMFLCSALLHMVLHIPCVSKNATATTEITIK